MALLPIFPLQTVLMPGARLPLQLFEPRYLAMLRDLMGRPQDSREFGVVAIRLGHEVGEDQATEVFDVGCAAEIEQVTAVGDGRFSVVARGGRRFRMGPLAVNSTPYLCAHVEPLEEGEADAEIAGRLAESVRGALTEYAALVPGRQDGELLPAATVTPTELSYAISAHTRLRIEDEQLLLEASDTVTRLRTAARLLRRETTLLRELSAVPVRAGMLPGRFSDN